MALLHEQRTPTLDDARKAAQHLRRLFDPGEVLLFGSVARGAQEADSDLDLVLVFDDLGDYTARSSLCRQARRAVTDATGLSSDIRVTDRPEWETRAKHCLSTFEAHVAANAVTLSSRPPRTTIDWNKKIGMAPTDEQQAIASLRNAIHPLNGLLGLLHPSRHESDALLAGDLRYADSMQRSRLLHVCAQAQTAMETSLKSLIHALKGPHPAHVHNIGGLLDAARLQLPEPDAARLQRPEPDASRLEAALGVIAPEAASVWLETGTYPADLGIDADPDTATAEFACQMAAAAAEMARTCIALIGAEVGGQPAGAEEALTQCDRIQQELVGHDKPGQSPHPDVRP